MTTIKSFTDIKQSRKLAEILPIESADACWTNHLFDNLLSSWRIESTPPQEYKSLLDRFVVKGCLIEPAWSLAALINVLPAECECMSLEHINYGNNHKKYFMSYVGGENTDTYDNPIDACVEMILKLHELKLL